MKSSPPRPWTTSTGWLARGGRGGRVALPNVCTQWRGDRAQHTGQRERVGRNWPWTHRIPRWVVPIRSSAHRRSVIWTTTGGRRSLWAAGICGCMPGTPMAPVPGFPPDSAHAARFPLEPELRGRLADTIWSSPALADLNRDGYLEIILARMKATGRRAGLVRTGFPPAGGPTTAAARSMCSTASASSARLPEVYPGDHGFLPGRGGFEWGRLAGHCRRHWHVLLRLQPRPSDVGLPGVRLGSQWQRLAGLGRRQGGGRAEPASPAIGDLDGDGKPEVVDRHL